MSGNRFGQFAPQAQPLEATAPAANRFAQFAPPAQEQPQSDMQRRSAAWAEGMASISPERRAQIERANAASMQEVDQAQSEAIVAGAPVWSRAVTAAQGIPFVGEYFDEFAGLVHGPQGAELARRTQRAVEDTRPGQAAALRIGTGVATSIPMMMMAAPAAAGMSGATPVGNMLRGAMAGAGIGATEGAISGFGAGNDGDRMRSAAERGIAGGAAGGVVGLVAPALMSGGRALLSRFRRSDVATIAREFGVSPDAARAIRQALDAEDFAGAQAALQRAGGRAMLADAGEASRTLLDASITGSARAARIGREAVDARAAEGGREFTTVLDRFFGRPQGVRTAQSGIRSATARARASAYEAAYAQPIDYSARSGLRLESLWSRVPEAVRSRASRLMQLEGVQSQQVMARIQPDGSVVFSRPADVRQWDYIARALGDMAESGEARGAMGGMTAESRALSALQRQIRDTLRGSVPGYDRALAAGRDTIRQTQAVRIGSELLRPGVTREQAAEALRGMTRAERAAARQGLRSAIDDMMAQTRQALTDPNMDAREALTAWRALSSRQAQDNIALLMDPGRAAAFAREVDRIATDFELRAAIAQNSRTAIRGAVQGQVRQSAAPGLLDTIAETGSPAQASQRLIQALTGGDPGARAAREAGLFAEIADALTRTRGAAEAQRIMGVVGQSMGSEPISRARAEAIARYLTAGAAAGAYQQGTRSLTAQ